VADRLAPTAHAASESDESFALTVPAPTLPKGGGAIRGMGEQFGTNPVSGTGQMRVPIFTSPGRSGAAPQLALAYDSAAGNGVFGFGWQLALPSITRKTSKGLPRYRDAEESDVFILSDTDDLVPEFGPAPQSWQRQPITRSLYGKPYRVERYRPRIEGLLSRIERWSNATDRGDVFWRSISKDNVTIWYGRDPASRIVDPNDPGRIFSWLICESHDDKGNLVLHEYKREDSAGVDPTRMNERNRTPTQRGANRYLKRIRYGNASPYYPEMTAPLPVALPASFLFEIVFDYGEHDPVVPLPDSEVRPWSVRPDPFSSYRATFEIRCCRRCRRVLMFHHFADEQDVGLNCLVRSTDFAYSDPPADPLDPVYSFLMAAGQTGYRRQAAGYLASSLPPVEFTYTQATLDPTLRDVDAASLENLPAALDGADYRWLDLDGEGSAGILTRQGGAWFYKPNLSAGNGASDDRPPEPRFGPMAALRAQPAGGPGGPAQAQLVDLSGSGQLDLVAYDGPDPGFYERNEGYGWGEFTPFRSLPSIDWRDPNLRFVDITGDGFADLLISEDQAFIWMRSLAKGGFEPAERVQQMLDEEKGPNIAFADGTESIFLADMSGDGLTDLVRVRNGAVCYWPNLGYGHFGAKVAMDDAPRFDAPDLFDARRIRLADIDGSGTVDIVYFGPRGTSLWFNLSGNAWSAARAIARIPPVDDLASAEARDLLGSGTACLTWSSPLPGNAQRRLRYVDLMAGGKPHLLTGIRNNLGAEIRVSYAPSTRFYVQDKLAGRPWVTRIPFPVHVVERVETYDWISRNRFITRYAYHHGYYDGVEREFRGFAGIDQWDTEEIAVLGSSDEFPASSNIDPASNVPPVWTRTWFHTGTYFEGGRISRRLAAEYYDEGDSSDAITGLSEAQRDAMRLADTVMPTTLLLADGSRQDYVLSAGEMREACRALKGVMLRQEIYALDGSDASDRPYRVTESNFAIEVLQPRGRNRHAVFLSHPRESVTFAYERKLYPVGSRMLADPRVNHAMTLAVDAFGNVLASAAIGYGRRHPDPVLDADDQAKQASLFVIVTLGDFAAKIDDPDARRVALPVESRTYQLVKCRPASTQPDVTSLFGFDEFAGLLAEAGNGAHDLPFEDWQAQGATENAPYRRLLSRRRILYLRQDLTGALPLGQATALALPFESYKQVFTPGLLTAVYGGKAGAADLAAMLTSKAGYVDLDGDGNYWARSGRKLYSPDPAAPDPDFARTHFFMGRGVADPFGAVTKVDFDTHDLLPSGVEDALGNRVGAQNDYRVLQAALITDPNGNRTAASFDALGLVAGGCVMGKISESLGDSLANFPADLTQAEIAAFLGADDPTLRAGALLGDATSRIVYDVNRFRTTSLSNPGDPGKWQPVVAAAIGRETHAADLASGAQSRLRLAFGFSDGFGRVIQTKRQARPAVAGGPLRWIGSGWTIYDNKGSPVRQYEPFFSALAQDAHGFEYGNAVGVSPIVLYDPLGRAVGAINPNHAWSKVVIDPWFEESWDGNDTAAIADPKADADIGGFFLPLPDGDYLPTWHAQREAGALGAPEQDAAAKTAIHAATPMRAYLDSLGSRFLAIDHNRSKPSDAALGDPPTETYYASRVIFDVQRRQREVIDALGRIVMRFEYDMLGAEIHRRSMEAAETWLLSDVTGQPAYAWDGRGHAFRTEYDLLRRAIGGFVVGADPTAPTREVQVSRTVYGDDSAAMSRQVALAANLLTRIFQRCDGANVVFHRDYDFKGNLLRIDRQLTADYTLVADWSTNPAPSLESRVFTESTAYDALNRAVLLSMPDGSLVRPGFDESGSLQRLAVNLQDGATGTDFIADIAYDPKGQRLAVLYGNGTRTDFGYDPATFRLMTRKTIRVSDQAVLQDLGYAYDPVGNITQIADAAQQALYFNNQVVTASHDYTYDSLYRLISAAGREQIGQASQPQTSWNDQFRVQLAQPGDGQAMRGYVEQYSYDAVGNLLSLAHQAAGGAWTRSYTYRKASLIEPAKVSNRLSGTAIGGSNVESYAYDASGNMLSMPHLSLMQWDYRDQLQATARQSVTVGAPETTWYRYDLDGRRVRKVTVRQDGTRKSERIYLGLTEFYREYDASGATAILERETLHVMDDDDRAALVETRTLGSDASAAQLIRYQYGDQVGSALLEADPAGRIITYEEYYPYGATSYQAGRSVAEAASKRYRFTGKERDEETGANYHSARYYAPWLGIWLAADRKGLIDGPNLYRYVRNRPVVANDPSGNGEGDYIGADKVLEEGSIDVSGRTFYHVIDWFGSNPETVRGFSMAHIQSEGFVESTGSRGKYGEGVYAFESELDAMSIAHNNWGTKPVAVFTVGQDVSATRLVLQAQDGTTRVYIRLNAPGGANVRPTSLSYTNVTPETAAGYNSVVADEGLQPVPLTESIPLAAPAVEAAETSSSSAIPGIGDLPSATGKATLTEGAYLAKTAKGIGLGVVASYAASKVGNFILYVGKDNVSDEEKKSTAALFGAVPPAAIPAAYNARFMTDLIYAPIIHSFYYGNYEKQRADNPQLTDKEFNQFWDERYDKNGYEIPWQLLPENQ
jgi:RHS repeat-associated protein